MGEWTVAIGPRTGGIDRELPEATGRRYGFKLTEPSDCSVAVDGRDPEAAWLTELATDLHVSFRRHGREPWDHLYRGRVGKSGDTLSAGVHDVAVPSVDYRGVLDRRALMSGSTQTWTATDQALIGWGLITQAQNKPGGDYGIVQGLGQNTGVNLDRSFALGDKIASKITETSDRPDGFDWDISAPDAYTLRYDVWYPQRGQDRGVVLEWGADYVQSLQRQVDSSTFANAIRQTGQAPDGGGSAPAVRESIAPNIATALEGRWDMVVGTDLTTDAAMKDRIDWQLGESQTVTPTYTFTMEPGWWQGPSHVWLGDPIRTIVYSGRLKVDTSLRVHNVDITPNDDGDESVQLTVGGPRPNPKRRRSAIERRLSELERR